MSNNEGHNIAIFVGSVYGGAQFVAEQLLAEIEAQQHKGQIFEQADVANFTDPAFDTLLVVTSTTGQGDLPDNIAPAFEQLRDQFPLLPNKKYGVVALGDSSYDDTFCGAGKKFDDLLAELQANKVGERLDIDACEFFQPEEAALPWIQAWLPQLG